ncbi:hypothetical protein LguiA_007110 [Lonicera macranthoides]
MPIPALSLNTNTYSLHMEPTRGPMTKRKIKSNKIPLNLTNLDSLTKRQLIN